MSKPSLCLIGAGRAGGSLARQWQKHGGFEVKALITRSGTPTLAEALGALNLSHIESLPETDAVLIASHDKAISAIAKTLAKLPRTSWQGKLVFHLSGALPAETLSPLKERGAHIASAHPVRAFSSDHTDFDPTWVGLEGEKTATDLLRPAFEIIGGHCFDIKSVHKTQYHAAAVLASNHLVALADAAQKLWQGAGVQPDAGQALFSSLVTGVLMNLEQASPTNALTGPVARGDSECIHRHLQSLDETDPNIASLYRSLSLYLNHMMRDEHTSATKEAIQAAIDN